jgi:heat shock protein HslJ
MFSTYTLKGNLAIKIKPLASTKKYCDNNIEIDYSQQLEKVDNYTISQDGKKLNLNIAKTECGRI